LHISENDIDSLIDLKLKQLLVDNSPDEKGYTKSSVIAQAIFKIMK